MTHTVWDYFNLIWKNPRLEFCLNIRLSCQIRTRFLLNDVYSFEDLTTSIKHMFIFISNFIFFTSGEFNFYGISDYWVLFKIGYYIFSPTELHLKNVNYLYSPCSNPTNVVLVIVLSIIIGKGAWYWDR
jgi:hypothetical protein